MQSKSIRSRNFVWFGIALGTSLYILDSLFDVYFLKEGTVAQQIFEPNSEEIWLRAINFIVCTLCGIILLKFARRQTNIQDKLQQSTHDIKSLFCNLPDAAVLLNDRNRIVDLNSHAERLISFTKAEIAGSEFTANFHPFLGSRYRDEVRRESKDSFALRGSSKYVVFTRDQEKIIVDVQLFPMVIDNEQLSLGIIRDRTKQTKLDDAIRGFSHGIESTTGASYFQKLVLNLSKTLDATYVFIAQINGDPPDSATTLAVCIENELSGNYTYKLEDTPCAQVIKQGICHYPSGIQLLFPNNPLLSNLDIESYLGIPLNSSEGKLIGILVVIDNKPLLDVDFTESIIEIFASRAAAEMERSFAEQALRASEESLQATLASMDDLLFILDKEGVFTDFRAPVRDSRLYQSPEVFLGKSYRDIMPPAVVEKLDRALQKVYSSSGTAQTNYSLTIDGTDFWFNARFTPRCDSTGQIIGTTAVVRDITEQRNAEEALLNSEATLRATLESTGDGILVVGYNGQTIQTNDRFAELWKIPQNLIDQRDDQKLLAHVFDQLVDPQAFISKVEKLYQSSNEDFDTLLFKDGRVFERFSSPLILNDQVAGRVWSFRDVSGRVQVEEELRRNKLMIDKANASIFWINPDASLIDVNNAICELLGYSREELLSMSVFDFDKSFLKEKWSEEWQQTKQMTVTQSVSEHTRKDGRVIPVEIISNHIDYRGEEFHCCFVTDITERRRNETVQSVLYEISEATGRVSSLVELLEVVHKQVGRLIDTNNFYVALYDEVTELYSFPFLRDATSVNPEDIPPQELKRSFTDYVRRTGQALLMTKENQLALIESGEADLVGELSEIWMGIPLFLSERVIGVVGIQSYTNEAQYTPQDKDLMSIVSSSIAMAIERKRSERELATANQMMRNVLDTIPVRVYWKDVNSVYLGCNELFAFDAGLDGAELVVGKTDADLKWGSSASGYLNSDRDIIKTGISKLDYVEPIDLPDGSSGWAHSSKIPLRDTHDRIVGVLGVYQDISDRIRAEEAVRHERDIAQRYLNIAGVLLLALDPNGTIKMINPKGCRILGYSRDQLIGENWFDKCIPAESRTTIKREFEILLTGARGNVFYFENPVLTAKGEARLISWNDTLVRDEDGKVVGTLSSGEDITDRKRSEIVLKDREAKLAEAQRIAKVGSWQYYIKDDFMEASDELHRIFGLDPAQKVTRSGVFSKLTHPDDKEMVVESCRASNHDGIPVDMKYRIIRPDGEIRHVHERGRVKLDESGNPDQIFGTVQDITELVKTENERKALESQLRRTQRLETIGTLAGGIAHDFNNILTPILGYADMAMISVPEDHNVREDLEHVIKAAHRAKDLVKQILAFSRQGDQEKKPLEVHLIVKEVLELLRASLPSTIEIRQDVSKDCGSVLADPSQIHQVIMNLCTNAFHAMRANGGTLTVALKLDTDFACTLPKVNDQHFVRLTVSDTGHGMTKSTMDRIFEPFFTTKGVGEGTGLGLSVVHGIITNHGGEITVESEQGKGTTFNIYLPRVQPQTAEIDSGFSTSSGGNEHLLIVDDEEEITIMAKRLLEKLGYRVTTRNSSVDALKLFSASPREFDMVITDQTMPYLSGSDLASELMAIRPDIPVIMMTGYSEAITAKSARRLGIRDFLCKPLVASELNSAIRKHLANTKTSEV